ncbi:protein phosphatase CheZ [Methylobrevis pamukkalensis]|uniref:Chemotaxis regulator CheZ n=1 Tax=Methylobrevis pamukkalensis TaxID=1439726 RepID=A0A1E3H5Y8_9HYPH|nr:protein phosphatase CheZ [Methylobrevis pamukkalensis]ODN71733.1 chemotaxis regulator CheZ [Methylobrevis pamukkalensis]
MEAVDSKAMAKVIEYLQNNKKKEDITINDVMTLAEVMADSLKGFFSTLDMTIYDDLAAMSEEITTMKSDLAALRLSDMRQERLPTAGRELDAVVEATEEATNTIMSAAEVIMAADTSDPDAYQTLVNDKVIEIFEACSFQDISGQRIKKVVETLDHIDRRVSALVEKLKLAKIEISGTEDETDEERRRRELILHGPQFKGEGVNQSEIDSLFP